MGVIGFIIVALIAAFVISLLFKIKLLPAFVIAVLSGIAFYAGSIILEGVFGLVVAGVSVLGGFLFWLVVIIAAIVILTNTKKKHF